MRLSKLALVFSLLLVGACALLKSGNSTSAIDCSSEVLGIAEVAVADSLLVYRPDTLLAGDSAQYRLFCLDTLRQQLHFIDSRGWLRPSSVTDSIVQNREIINLDTVHSVATRLHDTLRLSFPHQPDSGAIVSWWTRENVMRSLNLDSVAKGQNATLQILDSASFTLFAGASVNKRWIQDSLFITVRN